MTTLNVDDSEMLIASDGTNFLYIIDPQSLVVKETIDVFLSDGSSLDKINCLCSVPDLDNYIFANVYHSESIYFISLDTGEVLHSWNMQPLHDVQFDFAM